MNIPPKYEDVVAQLETERARVTDYIAQRAQTELKLEAALGREAALCKWQSEQSDKMDALREELGQCGSMAAMIEDKEWAEHAGSGPVSSRVESAFTQLHNELSEAQQRLTVAEQRAGELHKWVIKYRNVVATRRYSDNDEGDMHQRADRIELSRLDAALKPAEEGEGS